MFMCRTPFLAHQRQRGECPAPQTEHNSSAEYDLAGRNTYAVDHLGFAAAHFDVRKGNERVWQFHERFGAARTAETELDYLYRIEAPAITASRIRYRRILDGSVTVVASD